MLWEITRWALIVLWAVGIVGFLVRFFRGWRRGFLYGVLGLVALIVGIVVQAVVIEWKGYPELVETVSRIGMAILFFAGSLFVAVLAAMTVYTIRRGQSDDQQGKVVTENRPLNALSLGYGRLAGWSRRKILVSKSGFITVESLVDGTVTSGERIMVCGIITVFLSFFLIWVGIGLLLMKHLWFLGLVPVLPGLWVYYNLREDWRAYRRAKKQFMTVGVGEQFLEHSKEGDAAS